MKMCFIYKFTFVQNSKGLILKQRQKATQKWLIEPHNLWLALAKKNSILLSESTIRFLKRKSFSWDWMFLNSLYLSVSILTSITQASWLTCNWRRCKPLKHKMLHPRNSPQWKHCCIQKDNSYNCLSAFRQRIPPFVQLKKKQSKLSFKKSILTFITTNLTANNTWNGSHNILESIY